MVALQQSHEVFASIHIDIVRIAVAQIQWHSMDARVDTVDTVHFEQGTEVEDATFHGGPLSPTFKLVYRS